MKKLSLFAIGLYAGMLSAFSQTTPKDSAGYKSRKLNIEEVNFVTSYYQQNGNNAATTGGIGSEWLTDYVNDVEVKLSRYDKRNRRHNIVVDLGLDSYTSASSDKIDPKTLSSASYTDLRFYPAVSYNLVNEEKGNNVGASISYSTEFDYTSYGGGLNFTKTSKDKNREFNIRLQGYMDKVKLIRPVEYVSPPGEDRDGWTNRNTYNAGFTFSQVINTRLQMAVLLDLAYQKGFLGMPFNRVYFSDASAGVEQLPDTRFKWPVAMRLHYFLGDRFIIQTYYRYYHDDWGLKAHTAHLETTVKLSPFLSVTPFYRFYTQTAIDYFAPYRANTPASVYHSSDYDLSGFDAHFYGAGIRWAPIKGILGIPHWSMIDLRYGHYDRSTGLQSNVISLHTRFRRP
jgi:hypothetical protein